ncbi:MAG: ribonuclease III [Patescibacteria group bacterium]
MDFNKLAKQLGLKFKNIELLNQALIHRSYINEHPEENLSHNERLEFLGDAVLELVVTEHLFNSFDNPEGELTNWRAALVNTNSLADVAEAIELNDYIMLSKGEAQDDNTKARSYILADAVEAVIGAVYLDQGFEAAKNFIHKNIIIKLPEILEKKLYIDAKTKFQEAAQEKVAFTPVYKVEKEWGPAHAKHFEIGVYLGEELIATGEGTNKQEAQMAAAEKALEIKKW